MDKLVCFSGVDTQTALTLVVEIDDFERFATNHLKPCHLLENSAKLPEIVEAAKAVSTDIAAPENVHELAGKCQAKPEHGRLLLMRYGVENRKSNAIIQKSTSEDELTDNIRKAIDFVFY